MGIAKWMKSFGGNILYYPGCLTKGVLSSEFDNYKEIFKRLGIDYILLPDAEVCCGLPVLNAGYKKDARKLAEKNFDLFKKYGVKKIITNCPSCYHMFKEIYPMLVRDWNLEIKHATITILNALNKKRIRFRGSDAEREILSYHDPCYLGRYSGIYEEPRKVIELLGGKILEFRLNRKNAFCCGGGGGVHANFPEVAKAIAKRKASFISETAQKIISPCGLCHINFKSATEKSVEFSDFVLEKLKEISK